MAMIDQKSGRRVEGLNQQTLNEYARLHGMTPEDALNKIALSNMTAGNIEDTVRTLRATERQYSDRAAAGESAAQIREERAQTGAAMQSGPSNADIRWFAAEQGMSNKAAKETLQKYQRDSSAPEFANMTAEQRRSADIAVSGLVRGSEKAPRQGKSYIKPPSAEDIAKAAQAQHQAFSSKVAFLTSLKDAPPELRKAYKEGGIDRYNLAVQALNARVAEEQRLFQNELDRMPGSLQVAYYTGGVEGLNKAINEYNANIRAEQDRYDRARVALEPYRDGEYFDTVSFLQKGKSPSGMTKAETLEALGYDSDYIKDQEYMASKNRLQRFGIALTPWKEEKGETSRSGTVWVNAKTGNKIDNEAYQKLTGSQQAYYYADLSSPSGGAWASRLAAELVIPGYMVAKNWKDLNTAERAIYTVIDAAAIIPVAGAITKGAREAASLGRGAMLAGALRGGLKEAGALARAPIDVIIHPIGTAKAAGKTFLNLAENIAHPRKLPEIILTTTEGTVRFRITDETTRAEALAMRDSIMQLAARGERPIVQMGDQVIELARSPFMQEYGGGVVHSTPMGEAFRDGLTVSPKPNLPLSEQGLFVANEPLPRFAFGGAFGGTGKQPTIYVMSKELAQYAVPTGKAYKSPIGLVAEMELKFPVGADIPKPSQRLFTRINGTPVVIYLDKPLQAKQILKLKALAIIETVKAPFKPAIGIKGVGTVSELSEKEIALLAKELKAAGNIDQAANIKRAAGISRANRVPPRALERITGKVSSQEIARARERIERSEMGGYRRAPAPDRPERISDEDMRRVLELTRNRRWAETQLRREKTRLEREATRLQRREPERAERLRTTARAIRRELTRRETAERERIERAARFRGGKPPVRTERITTTERTPRPEPTPERPPRVPLPPDIPPPRVPPPPKAPPLKLASDKDKRAYIKTVGAVAAQNMGKLGRKNPQDIWHVWLTNGKRIVVKGPPPEGVKITADGPGSARLTTQTIGGGKLRRIIKHRHGAVSTTITPAGNPRGAQASFTSMPAMKSVRRGKIYHTKAGAHTLLSRRPLGRHNGQRR